MSGTKPHRALKADEIAELERRGSRSEDWSRVRVVDGFSPDAVARVTFGGDVVLGGFRAKVGLPGGEARSGVYDSRLVNVRVGDDALVDRVGLLANYDVGAGASVMNCGHVAVEGKTAFGNGVEIDVLNEGGGRELKLFERLSAQLAYMAVCYRHRPKLVAALDRMADEFADARRSSRGTIGEGARVWNCARIVNVAVGPAATVDGAAELVEGSVLSNTEAPSVVGAGVVAREFIFATGSTVDGRAIVSKTFVGQGTRIGRQFSAEACAFFANCEGFHGEAVSVLAGPHTVTHHKSTLLIAGMLSFYNAGSATNQSNHMYKMGPVHQGVLERGSKTGSSSYLLWPARVGAFTAVIGKHYSNFDTRNLPFSYITDEKGRSVLAPGTNLFTVGTRRDGEKWPARDRRTDPDRLDTISFAVFSPYTVGRILKGHAEVSELYANASRELDYVTYNGISVKRLLCRAAKKHYALAIKIYFGDVLARRLEAAGDADPAETLAAGSGPGAGEWVDVLGLLAPRAEVEALCDSIERGEAGSLAEIEGRLRALDEIYDSAEWVWAADAWARWSDKPFDKRFNEMTREELGGVVRDWRDARVKLNNMILGDAEKEYTGQTRIGFGIDGADGDDAARDADFEAVRGTFDANKFVGELRRESAGVAERAERILARLG
ncbi:MAG: DUF4954 family protein [Planctomycetota bacterium]|jgi:hypothetical protein